MAGVKIRRPGEGLEGKVPSSYGRSTRWEGKELGGEGRFASYWGQ